MLGFLTYAHLGKGTKPISNVAEPTRWTLNNQINNRVMIRRGDLRLNTPQTILGCRESLVFFTFSNFCISDMKVTVCGQKNPYTNMTGDQTQNSSALPQDRQVPTYNKCSKICMQNEEVRHFKKISATGRVAL
jgi:hypothetical protein